MKFAFLMMGQSFPTTVRTELQDGHAQLIGVPDIDAACAAARELQENGIGCIELCGAFREEGARRIIAATQNKIPVGYITHLPEQEDVYAAAFAKPHA